jgi:hypothetical protein
MLSVSTPALDLTSLLDVASCSLFCFSVDMVRTSVRVSGPLEAQPASLPDNDEPAHQVSTPGAWLQRIFGARGEGEPR